MAFVAVTRLRLRSLRYVLQFVWYALITARQAEQADGFLTGKLARDSKLTFWTITIWDNEKTMRAYRNAGVHARVMPKLAKWCDESSFVHWQQESVVLPKWQDAHQRMVKEGKFSKVNNPSPAQVSRQVVEPPLSMSFERAMKCRGRQR